MLNPNRIPAVSVVCIAIASCLEALAGGGPENVLLVVNPRSEASVKIADHYAALRKIPAAGVLRLPWDPKDQTTDVKTFRQKILGPILEAIRTRGLAPQLDYVVYSSDFPWAINLRADFPRDPPSKPKPSPPKASKETETKPPQVTKRKWPVHLSPTGSLNGLTYLWRLVASGTPAYMGLRNNQYMRRAIPEQKDTPTLAFKSTTRFGPHGEVVTSGGQRYLLSSVLGVTAGRGNTVEEVLDYLSRSAAADGTHPPGTIYFLKNGNVRSRVRDRAFPTVVSRLEELGVSAQIIQGVVPKDKPDVQGAMLGTAKFDWKASGSTILPGAICEHLTSYGGVMRKDASQTPLSEFLRYGAAGSCGTVVEPYAIQEKFPMATIHVHYARGCSLAEAFYQSVYGPYQLLIVGDPLCRPWANVPKVAVEGVEPDATVSGRLTLSPSATVTGKAGIGHFELFVDGKRVARCDPKKHFELDTTRLADGPHELRIVAIEAGPISSQGRLIVPVKVLNRKGE